jgi:hypothetical protein
LDLKWAGKVLSGDFLVEALREIYMVFSFPEGSSCRNECLNIEQKVMGVMPVPIRVVTCPSERCI